MRRIKLISLALLTILIVFVIFFYNRNLRGIWPAIKNPPEDITIYEDVGLPLKLPADFSISIYAKDLVTPRVITNGPGGIFVSEMDAGKVTLLIDSNYDGKVDQKKTVIEGLHYPHGIAFRCQPTDPEKTKYQGVSNINCKIYIAETQRVVEYDYDEAAMRAINGKKIVDLPTSGRHYTRTLLFRPYPNENDLLISIGSSCNACIESDNRRAKILKYDTVTGKLEEFANGLRNSVFMAVHPITGKIWATEMGRDLIGDNAPPEEINIIEQSKNYGWPICYGKNIHDISFDKNTYKRNPCMEPFDIPAHIEMQAHSAPLGLSFFPEEGWPEEYWHNLLVAYHGSWNRTEPTGYKVVRIKLDQNGNQLAEPEDFITGWLTPEGALGRPVDIIIQPGGTIYISDDKAGVIYLIKHKNP